MRKQDKSMKFRNSKTGEVFEDIEAARYAYCLTINAEDCFNCNINHRQTKSGLSCDEYAKAHPAETARLMGYEVAEASAEDEAWNGKSLFCEHIGVLPGQPFVVRGYPCLACRTMVYEKDGCVRLYAPDGQRRREVGERIITWIVDHPESVEPCKEHTEIRSILRNIWVLQM